MAYGLYGGFSTLRRLISLGHSFDHKNLNYALGNLALIASYPTMMFNHGPLVQTAYLFGSNLIALGDTSVNYNQYAGNLAKEAASKGIHVDYKQRSAPQFNVLAIPKLIVGGGTPEQKKNWSDVLHVATLEIREGLASLGEATKGMGQLAVAAGKKLTNPNQPFNVPAIFDVVTSDNVNAQDYTRNMEKLFNGRRVYAAGALGGMALVLMQGAGVMGHAGSLFHRLTTAGLLLTSSLRAMSYAGVSSSMWHLKANGKTSTANQALAGLFGAGAAISSVGSIDVSSLPMLGLERFGRSAMRPLETYRHLFKMKDGELIPKQWQLPKDPNSVSAEKLTAIKKERAVVLSKVSVSAVCMAVDVIAAAALMGGPWIKKKETEHDTSYNPLYYLIYKYGHPSERIRHFYEHPSHINPKADIQETQTASLLN